MSNTGAMTIDGVDRKREFSSDLAGCQALVDQLGDFGFSFGEIGIVRGGRLMNGLARRCDVREHQDNRIRRRNDFRFNEARANGAKNKLGRLLGHDSSLDCETSRCSIVYVTEIEDGGAKNLGRFSPRPAVRIGDGEAGIKAPDVKGRFPGKKRKGLIGSHMSSTSEGSHGGNSSAVCGRLSRDEMRRNEVEGMVEFDGFMANKEGNAIVRKILALGVSQYRLAKDLPISREQVKKWVRNYSSPNDENLEKLRAFYYKVRIELNLQPFDGR